MPTWSKRIAMSCMRKGIINEDQIPWFIYGIEKRIASLFISIPFLLFALLLTTPWCAISFFISFYLLRRRTSGYHACSIGSCLCTSLLLELLFFGVVYPMLQAIHILCVIGICLPVIYFLAPYNDPKMHFSKAEISACRTFSRKYLCILSVSSGVTYLGGMYEVSKGITLALAMTSFLLCVAYYFDWRNKK